MLNLFGYFMCLFPQILNSFIENFNFATVHDPDLVKANSEDMTENQNKCFLFLIFFKKNNFFFKKKSS